MDIPPFIGAKINYSSPRRVLAHTNLILQVFNGFVHLLVFVAIAIEKMDPWIVLIHLIIPDIKVGLPIDLAPVDQKDLGGWRLLREHIH